MGGSMIKYTDYTPSPHLTAVIGGKVVPVTASAIAAIAFWAMPKATPKPERST